MCCKPPWRGCLWCRRGLASLHFDHHPRPGVLIFWDRLGTPQKGRLKNSDGPFMSFLFGFSLNFAGKAVDLMGHNC